MNSAPEIKAKFDAPDFVENNEEMLKEEFTNYFAVSYEMNFSWIYSVKDRIELFSKKVSSLETRSF